MIAFVVLFSVLLAMVWAFVGWSFVFSLNPPAVVSVLAQVFLITTYGLQVLRWTYFQKRQLPTRLLLTTYWVFGLMIHLFFGGVVKEFILLLCYGANQFFDWNIVYDGFALQLSYGLGVLCTIANLWGVRTALRGPVVRKVFIPVKGWPASQRDFSIVQLSDLHVGPLIGKKYVQKIVDQILKLRPSLVVATGDIGDGDVNVLHDDLSPLAKIAQTIPSYYVTGNHEYYWGVDNWIKKMTELGFRHLLNRGEKIKLTEKHIWLAGIPDLSGGRFKADHVVDTKAARDESQDTDCLKVLLAHQPAACFGAQQSGFDVMLSGHTHGGQFFPISLLVGFFNPYSVGLNNHLEMWVYVNSGTGFWGPPLRLGVPSEITQIQFVSKI